MHIFIAGICGTFMAGVALLARERGWRVAGCDANVYPPMSDQLREAGIEVLQGYDPAHLGRERPDVVVIGNALSRGNPLIEHVLDEGLPYVSGPQWLGEHVLCGRHVLAVAGTHGKTTTSSMLAWILECACEQPPGFLIGGIPADFGRSARLGAGRHFVIEADEYDTAFFDKRSKFLHYRPRGLIVNNMEYDHADIFPDLAAIQRQFHHLVRTVPASGSIVHPAGEAAVDEVFAMGLWSHAHAFALDRVECEWNARLLAPDGSAFVLRHAPEASEAIVEWQHGGRHNVSNALAAAALAHTVGVPLAHSAAALAKFKGVKRRMELVAEVRGVRVYDDFAHHPTAIELTLQGLRAAGAAGRIVAVIELRSNTMRLGVHRERLAACTLAADAVLWYQPSGVDWDLDAVARASTTPARVFRSTADIVATLVTELGAGDRVVIMSNGGFEGIHRRLVEALAAAASAG
ncbi:MAG: UDP-N-acetylmuramate--L-alanyl-gamma-D-glutamyl-meso-2,6-diaminoheptandioate ligase [Pseudomonadales bacterium]|nr:UDP-N-acetylmuramate--L-alanyl-gamma-D-glutamyl-meso-2,6-diaminoheptandioate ligase [Pseudomonadales bacterium]